MTTQAPVAPSRRSPFAISFVVSYFVFIAAHMTGIAYHLQPWLLAVPPLLIVGMTGSTVWNLAHRRWRRGAWDLAQTLLSSIVLVFTVGALMWDSADHYADFLKIP